MAIYKKQVSGDKGWEKIGPKMSVTGEYADAIVSSDIAAIEAGGGDPNNPASGPIGFIPLEQPLGKDIKKGDKWRLGVMTALGYGGSRDVGQGIDQDASRDLAKGMNLFLSKVEDVISYEMGSIYPNDLDKDVNMNEI